MKKRGRDENLIPNLFQDQIKRREEFKTEEFVTPYNSKGFQIRVVYSFYWLVLSLENKETRKIGKENEKMEFSNFYQTSGMFNILLSEIFKMLTGNRQEQMKKFWKNYGFFQKIIFK